MPDSRLDELYREPPDRFIAARDRLAKDLRAGGDTEEAARMKKLRRPTIAAWLINRAALEATEQLREFAAASHALEEAQAKAVAGGEDAASGWRAAAARERDAIAGVVDVAERLAREAGHKPSARAVELVDGTLRAASGDPTLRERVLAGRVEREQSAATLGVLGAGAPSKRRRARAKPRESGRQRRELAGAERALAAAAKREGELSALAERAEQDLREAKARLSDAKQTTADLERQRNKVRRRASG